MNYVQDLIIPKIVIRCTKLCCQCLLVAYQMTLKTNPWGLISFKVSPK